ncbi:hypothetical protein CYY_006581 [Polysphondylium violaceum]|uniref:Ig-like domain-containing protein n=1 Tax=Polysphondylium violaceum TaxID=133409 RepID=A0A8J4V303_9MYCE|nr:hypothetical protein CYY_006581 [Polysphondylium violaceum]
MIKFIIYLILISSILVSSQIVKEINLKTPLVGIVSSSDTPFAIGKFQSPTSQTVCPALSSFCYLTGSDKDEDAFVTSRSSASGNCVAMIGKKDTASILSIYDTDKNQYVDITSSKKLNFTNLVIDDTYIWVTYSNISGTYLQPFIHSKCSKIELVANKTFQIDESQPETIYSTLSIGTSRIIYIYDKEGAIISKYEVTPDLNNLIKDETQTLNIGDACYFTLFQGSYWLVSSPSGFRVYDSVNEKKVSDFYLNDASNTFCGPFISKGLEIYSIPSPGDSRLFKVVPALEVISNRPCFNQSNGEIELTGTMKGYTYQWLDNGKTDLKRKNLKEGIYKLKITMSATNISITQKIDLRAPADPMEFDLLPTCLGSSTGGLNFTSKRVPGLNYTYTVSDGTLNGTESTNNPLFNSLLGNKFFYVNVTTVDLNGHVCEYLSNATIPNGVIPEFDVEYLNVSCSNMSDGYIAIKNYDPKNYTYEIFPPVKISSQGILKNLQSMTYTIFMRLNKSKKKVYGCPNIVNIDIMEPREFKFPSYNITTPKCFGLNGSLSVEYIPWMEYLLEDQHGDIHFPYIVNINRTSKWRNLPTGNYSMTCTLKSLRDHGICKEVVKYIYIASPDQIQLNDTIVTSSDCENENLSNMLAYAHGGMPFNGTRYTFAGSYANGTNAHLNVSYWIDGVYNLTIADSFGCKVKYTNFTIKRPDGCILSHNPHEAEIVEAKAQEKKHSKRLGLILGLVLGLALPIVLAIIAVAVFLAKKYGFRKGRIPFHHRNIGAANSIPMKQNDSGTKKEKGTLSNDGDSDTDNQKRQQISYDEDLEGIVEEEACKCHQIMQVYHWNFYQ